ncbi:hypothetical protein [Psychromonas aquimarina]|uniref:hypothetical protein n=1 Tax=Psychromonas aquimarina TaxID=444919 RepID=UPI0004118844|nr:hypothetical protein [Psychromonas aquimarina]
MTYKYSLLSIFTAAALAGCGGSSGSSSSSTASTSSDTSSTEQAVTTTLSGKAADGYLSNANVCLDLNLNKVCDTGEPSAASTSGGEFSLTGVTQTQIDKFPIIVEVVAGATIDEDDPGTVLTQGYTLSAPAGFTFVSPLTTMVQNEIEKGSTAEEAETAVKGKLGTTLNLADDYVAGKKDDSLSEEDKAEFKKLHQVAQVTANVISSNMALLEDTAQAEGIKVDDLISLIVDQVFDAMDEITVQIEAAEADDSTEFDSDSIAADIDKELITLEADKLQEQIAQQEAESQAVAASLVDLIKTEGINWFWGETDDTAPEFEYGTITVNEQGLVSDIEYSWETEQWVLQSNDNDDNNEWLLTSAGWTAYDDSVETVTLNSDATITLHHAGLPELNETIKGTQLALAGLNASLIMDETDGDGTWAEAIPENVVFPQGAVGYKLDFQQNGDRYTFNNWDGCDDQNKLGGLCNTVWHQKGTGNYEDNGAAVTLAEMVVANALSLSGTQEDIRNLNAVHLGWMGKDTLAAELVAGGKINYYKINYYDSTVALLTTGSWSDITVHGKTLRTISAPNYFSEYDGFFDDRDNIILLEYLDGVRIGEHKAADEQENQGFVFNSTARDFILANFDSTLISE